VARIEELTKRIMDSGKWEVFETPDDDSGVDLVAEMRPSAAGTASTADVDQNPVPPPERVFEVFAGRRFLSATQTRRVERTEASREPFETPLERYNRLRAEVGELARDLALDDPGNDDMDEKEVGNETYETLRRGILQLQMSLDELQHEPRNVALQQSMKDVNGLEKARDTGKAKLEALREAITNEIEEDESKAMQLELLYSSNRQVEVPHRDELEERVKALEASIGMDKAPRRPLLHAIEDLENLFENLDEGRLSLLSTKVKRLNSQLEESMKSLQKRKAPSYAGTNTEDIDELVRKLDQCDSIAASLPNVIDRLKTAHEIHQHNANIQTRLDEVDRLQEEIDAAAELDREVLTSLKQSIAENLALFNSALLEK